MTIVCLKINDTDYSFVRRFFNISPIFIIFGMGTAVEFLLPKRTKKHIFKNLKHQKRGQSFLTSVELSLIRKKYYEGVKRFLKLRKNSICPLQNALIVEYNASNTKK